MLNSNQHLEQFKELGYTVFENVFSAEQIALWKSRYHDMVERSTPPDMDRDSMFYGWMGSVIEQEPWTMLPAVNNATILDFAERVMGPFVQLDNLTLMAFPSVPKDDAEGKVSGWHRDRWGWLPEESHYIRPWACNAIAYLQDMTDDYGPLRVVEGSHRRNITVSKDDQTKPHPEEKLVYVKAGDVVFTHSSIMHSGTPNTTGNPRYFFSAYYTRVGLQTKDNHAGPNVQKIVQRAREKEDRRLMRLFGVDDLVEQRANSGFMVPDEEMWDKWISEDRAALKA